MKRILRSLIKGFEKKYWTLLILFFFLTRIVIVFFPTANYSDVTHYYERYANFWRYGLTPYFKHLYEYPPLSLPILYIPLELDQMGIGKYYINYRIETFFIETMLFICMLLTAKRFWPQTEIKNKTLLIYVLLTTYAIDWLYEGIDLSFTTFTFLTYLSVLWLDLTKIKGKLILWLLFWASTAIKFLTFPMLPIIYLVSKSDIKKDLLVMIFSFLIIWGIPIMIFRSSLSVSFVYNSQRPVKYSSFPALIIRISDIFTNTESQNKIEPDFEFVGPISKLVTNIDKYVYPLSIIFVVTIMCWRIFNASIKVKAKSMSVIAKSILGWIFKPTKLNSKEKFLLLIQSHALYLFVTFFTAKIFSQPFHLWYYPLIVLYPYSKNQKMWVLFSFILLTTMDMTSYLDFPISFRQWLAQVGVSFEPNIVRDALKYLPMFFLLTVFYKKLNLKKID